MALKTTLRASSQQGSGLSIAAVLCSIIIRYLRGWPWHSLCNLDLSRHWLQVAGKIYGISVVLGEIFCFFILKSLLELIIN